MTQTELLELLASEADFFASLSDLKEVVLYGSALVEEEIKDDVDLLLTLNENQEEYLESEKVDLRQWVWERLKDKLPVPLEVQAATAELNPGVLHERGVPIRVVYRR